MPHQIMVPRIPVLRKLELSSSEARQRNSQNISDAIHGSDFGGGSFEPGAEFFQAYYAFAQRDNQSA